MVFSKFCYYVTLKIPKKYSRWHLSTPWNLRRPQIKMCIITWASNSSKEMRNNLFFVPILAKLQMRSIHCFELARRTTTTPSGDCRPSSCYSSTGSARTPPTAFWWWGPLTGPRNWTTRLWGEYMLMVLFALRRFQCSHHLGKDMIPPFKRFPLYVRVYVREADFQCLDQPRNLRSGAVIAQW